MTKEVFKMVLSIVCDGFRGAPYTINGKDHFNNGEANEMHDKAVHGLPAIKDGNGAFDVTDDIPEYNASVKSSAATLTSKPLGDNFDEVVNAYFERVHSKNIWYSVSDYETRTVTIYKMNHTEFRQYLKLFSRFDSKRKVIRLNKDAKSVNLKWLEMKARA